MSFSVTIDKFDGPLDLMLHLVRENKLNLLELNLSELTNQYLTYIKEMETLSLEIESEYLVQLAILVEYKSKKLVPKVLDKIEGEYEEDPALVIANRLIMYQKYKEVTKELEGNYLQRQEQLTKSSLDISEYINSDDYDLSNVNGTPYDLMKAMNKVLRRIKLEQPLDTKTTKKEMSVDDRILQIKARLTDLPKTFSFSNLIEDCDSLNLFIVTFLAILDMAKHQFLVFTIDQNDEIWFKRRGN